MSYASFRRKIALNIRALRKKVAITQEGMEKFGFNIRHYQDIESGKVTITLETIFRLAKVFKTTPDKIVKAD